MKLERAKDLEFIADMLAASDHSIYAEYIYNYINAGISTLGNSKITFNTQIKILNKIAGLKLESEKKSKDQINEIKNKLKAIEAQEVELMNQLVTPTYKAYSDPNGIYGSKMIGYVELWHHVLELKFNYERHGIRYGNSALTSKIPTGNNNGNVSSLREIGYNDAQFKAITDMCINSDSEMRSYYENLG